MQKRWGWLLPATALLAAAAFAADDRPAEETQKSQQTILTLPCPQTDNSCNPSKSDLKKAANDFSKGLKLEKEKHIDQAYEIFDAAARLAPRNIDYLTALAVTREELVANHLTKGNDDLNKGLEVQAQAEFRSALNLDPENQFAQQRLQDSLSEWTQKNRTTVRLVKDSGEIHVVPNDSSHEFHFRGDSKALLTQVAATYGVAAEVDDSVMSRRVHFDLDSSNFYTAMQAACEVTGAFWSPLSESQVLVAKDTPDNRRLFDRMVLRTFLVENISTHQEIAELSTLLRVVFEIRFLQAEGDTGLVAVRAPAHMLDAVAQVLDNFGISRPQVLLDIEIYQIDHQFARNMGLHIPNTFNLFNVPASALLALAGANSQSLINSLIASGGINQANSQAISALLAQLQGQGNSIFSNPVATFGGGLTLMGLTLDHLAAQLSLNESWVRTLDHATLRAGQGADTKFHIGQRYPIINASFAPIFNTSAISQVLQNGSFQAPIPSFTYEDLGLDMKTKTVVHANSDVGLELEMQLRSLAGQSLNGVPVIANREYKGSIQLEDGEPAVVAAAVSTTEELTMTGIPGLGSIPILNQIATTTSKTEQYDELLVVITPHVVNLQPREGSVVWIQR
jgi:type II secretory pathway component GspD/PulD (secretin)